jgi:hypothetical protein
MIQTIDNLRQAVKDDFRLYFAPLVGAINAVRNEIRKVDASATRRPGNDATVKH